ncbi:hypothetical protein B0H12DRAFT_811910 [Mycena haematopus]|nr:hypothetical protein B0H12DRAFT_811910 [Mycena haematopus]
MEDLVMMRHSQTHGTDSTEACDDASSAYPTNMTLAAGATPLLEFDPYPYSLSTPGERPDPMDLEDASASASSASSGDKDSEKKEGDDATSAVTSSQDNDDGEMDEMELQYPTESDVKATADDDVENESGDADEMELQYPPDSDGKAADVEADNGASKENQHSDVEVAGDEMDHDLQPQYPRETDFKAADVEADNGAREEDATELQRPTESAVDDEAADVEIVNNAHEGDEMMHLQHSVESNAKAAGIEPEETGMDEVQSVEGVDEVSEESETDADGDDDPEYEDFASSVALDDTQESAVEEEPAAADNIVIEEPIDEPIVEERASEEPAAESIVIGEEPIVDELIVEERASEEAAADSIEVEPIVDELIVEERASKEPAADAPAMEELEEPSHAVHDAAEEATHGYVYIFCPVLSDQSCRLGQETDGNILEPVEASAAPVDIGSLPEDQVEIRDVPAEANIWEGEKTNGVVVSEQDSR